MDVSVLNKLPKQQKQETFYDIILTFSNKLASASDPPKTAEWLYMYDFVFKFGILDEDFETHNQYIIYNVFVRILLDFSRSMEKQCFLKFANNFIRVAAYISRFFIPTQKLKPLAEVAQDAATAQDAANNLEFYSFG